ncbi:unnamed protein product [Ilex paraguariensis]|uniref:Bet v I/Major latex protein domain-containing protein n=1 Tax=Ilex paraguariensis TaxID=185542 RepID=A0ABC8RHG6_9AQUA
MGKLVAQTEIKSDGDVFHEIFRYRPHHIKNMSPGNVQGVINQSYWCVNIDGKENVAKKMIQAIDEEKKSVTFKLIEGDLMELYNTFIATVHVDTKGENNLVKWTFEFEKLNEGVEDPNTLMNLCLAITKDIEAYHLK